MNAPTPEATSEHLLAVHSDANADAGKLSEQEKPFGQIENTAKQKIEIDADRIRSSIARLTSNSIGELEGLACELQKLDGFLKSETERVQREIESVMAGIKIIIDAIAPWKRPSTAPAGAARPAPISARSHSPTALGDVRRGL
jgi:hypothetical protein